MPAGTLSVGAGCNSDSSTGCTLTVLNAAAEFTCDTGYHDTPAKAGAACATDGGTFTGATFCTGTVRRRAPGCAIPARAAGRGRLLSPAAPPLPPPAHAPRPLASRGAAARRVRTTTCLPTPASTQDAVGGADARFARSSRTVSSAAHARPLFLCTAHPRISQRTRARCLSELSARALIARTAGAAAR